jgi:8-oxo-dGTP pyrophosphatase MutT (NUDIX family)
VTAPDAMREAAVLVPVYRDEDGVLRIVLVVRADDGGLHGGQIGLPGGRPEPGDADLRATALREAQEEIGLDPGAVTVLGALPRVATRATGYRVAPYLARLRQPPTFVLQEVEIVGVLTPSVEELADPAGRTTLPFTSRRFPEPIEVDGIDVDGHVLWGMTLRILDHVVPRLLGGAWDV